MIRVLTADIDGDGRAELLQLWDNGGTLAAIVYRWTGSGLTLVWSSNDMGAGIGAVSWLIGDLDGDGHAELLQLWDNGGTLASIVYRWTGSGLTLAWSSNDMGVGVGAVSWLMGDLDGDGRAELVQLWDNNGKLASIVFRWSSGLNLVWSSNDMAAGVRAISFLLADVNFDGGSELLQLWNNGGVLGVMVYRWTGSSLTMAWSSNNLGYFGSSSIVGDVDGDGYSEVVLSGASRGLFRLSLLAHVPPLGAPFTVAVTQTTSTSVSLTWDDNSSTETGYSISNVTTGASTVVGANITGTTIASLSANTRYCFDVSAYNASSRSPSVQVCATTAQPPPPATKDMALFMNKAVTAQGVIYYSGYSLARGTLTNVYVPPQLPVVTVYFVKPGFNAAIVCAAPWSYPSQVVAAPAGSNVDLTALFGTSKPQINGPTFVACPTVSYLTDLFTLSATLTYIPAP